MTCCPIEILDALLRMPRAALVLFLASVGALAAALIGQYMFDMSPCILCLYQRVPYVLVAALGGVMLGLCRDPKLDRILLLVCALAFLIGSGIAVFHSGVERHWWAGTDGCAVSPMPTQITGADIEAIRNQLLKTDVARCDVIDRTFFGLTLANLNIFAFLGLAVFALLASLKTRNPDRSITSACSSSQK